MKCLMNLPHSDCRYMFIRPVFRIFSRHYTTKILPYWVKHQAINHQNIQCVFLQSYAIEFT